MLEEEFQKREELERLKQQQEKMLEAEREEKASLQSDRDEQDRLLREAKEKLEQLELDKAAVASKMQVILIQFCTYSSNKEYDFWFKQYLSIEFNCSKYKLV